MPEKMTPLPPQVMRHNAAKTGETLSNETSYFKKIKKELPSQK
jgi:hypothetical protein